MSKMKKAPFMCNVVIGDTWIDVHGHGIENIEEAYIHDTDIDVWEMLHSLNFDKFVSKTHDVMLGV